MKKLVVTMLIATMAIASAGCSKAPEEPKTETTETTAKKEKTCEKKKKQLAFL